MPPKADVVLLPQPYVTTRADIVKELFDSEQAFLATLTYIVETLHPGFAAARGVPENHALCATIFGGIPPIRKLSQRLSLLLEKATRENPSDPFVADVFLDLANEFICFSSYISNQPQAIQAYRDAISDQRTLDAMKILLASKQAQGRSPEDIFALVFQRVCRYGLFLDRLIKTSGPTHPERESLLLASRKMQEIVGVVNSMRGEHERKVKLAAVAKLIEFNGDYPQFDIVIPGREIIYHGPLNKIRTLFNKPLYFFIFSDIIVCTEEQRSLFRQTRYNVKTVLKLDQYFKVTKHDQASPTKNWISIFQGLQHIGRHYDALTKSNFEQMLTAFDEVLTSWTINFIQSQAKDRLDEKLRRDRAVCTLCPRPLSRFGRNSCFFCKKQVCSDCFSCEFANRRCCTRCGEVRGVVPIHPRLIPHYRSYTCVSGYTVSSARMIGLSPGDLLEVYLSVNQRWGLGRNITTNQVGCFPLANCILDISRDQGENQNFSLFVGVFEPKNKPGAKNNFPLTLDVGDVIAVTWDNNDGWYYGYSLKTEKFGYVHYSDLVIVQNTELLKRKYL